MTSLRASQERELGSSRDSLEEEEEEEQLNDEVLEQATSDISKDGEAEIVLDNLDNFEDEDDVVDDRDSESVGVTWAESVCPPSLQLPVPAGRYTVVRMDKKTI